MYYSSASPVNLVVFLIITSAYSAIQPYRSIGDVAINCGSIGNSTALDGREWIGDAASKGKSTSSRVVDKLFNSDPVPFRNARISSTQFHYVLQVNPGQIFIRLHFYPGLYKGFEKSCDLFTVKAGSFILLRNFSASLSADALGVKHIYKEYFMNVNEDQVLTIVFSPSKPGEFGNTYAFINGIEIISMPTGLYYTQEGDLGPLIVGGKNRFYIDNQTALEMVQRLNTGGGPIDIYQTSWSTKPNKGIYSFTWKIPVDIGFGYLIRLHFCELEPQITKSGERNFNIFINNQMAEMDSDVIQWSGGNGIPVHRDYVVLIKGDKENGKENILVVVQSKTEFMNVILKGLEVMKLSNLDNNLAGQNPEFFPDHNFRNSKVRKLMSKYGLSTRLTIVIILVSIVVHRLGKLGEEKNSVVHSSLGNEANQNGGKYIPSTSTEGLCQRFSFAEIQSATRNFRDEVVIGKGGFGIVYKGVIENGDKLVAIKRLASYSKQGVHEFRMEIETLPKLRHVHLVSLIGYCNESNEMILVYEYMHYGTLADHLYTVDKFHLNWEQRLRICIGAARGLDYLHHGIVPGVIHRDVKDTNILLDENFIAKVSDFGIAKLENPSRLNSYITTQVKGTFGYLDPDYFSSNKLSKKSDVFAFGVVLLVVLCGRPAVDTGLSEDQEGLVLWAPKLIKNGEVEKIIDTTLKGTISSHSLNKFVEIAMNCLRKSSERPSMVNVVAGLEYALLLDQQANVPLVTRDVESTRSLYAVSESEEITCSGGPCTDQTITLYGKNDKSTSEGKKTHTSNNKPPQLMPWKTMKICLFLYI